MNLCAFSPCYQNHCAPSFKAFQFELNGETLYADDDNHVSKTNPDLLKDGETYEIFAEEGVRHKKIKNGGRGKVIKANFFEPLDADTFILKATEQLKDKTTAQENENEKLCKENDKLNKEIVDNETEIESAKKELAAIPPVNEEIFVPFKAKCAEYISWLKQYGAEYLKLGVTSRMVKDFHANNDKISLHEFMLRNKNKMLELFREVK